MKKIISIVLALVMMSEMIPLMYSHAIGEESISSYSISIEEFVGLLSDLNEYYSSQYRVAVKTRSNDALEDDFDAVAKVEGFNNWHILQFDSSFDMYDVVTYFESQPDTLYAQSDNTFTFTGSTTVSAVGYCDYHDFDYLCDYIDDNSISLADVKVGIIDTGVYAAHEIFTNRDVNENDFITGTGGSGDSNGHGTAVTSIIAQYTTSNVSIYSYNATSSTSVYAAVYRAVCTDNVDVLNLSFDTDEEDKMLTEAIRYAYANGITVIAQSGNNGGPVCWETTSEEVVNEVWPACMDEVITVASFNNDNKKRSDYSSYGEAVDIAAIGGSALRIASKTGTSAYCPYYDSAATSFAAPVVAAAAAMLKSIDNTLSSDEIKALLTDGATAVEDDSDYNFFGAGIVNFVGAAEVERTEAPTISLASGRHDNTQTVTFTHTDTNAVIYYNTTGIFANSDSAMTGWTQCSPGDSISLSGICTLRAIAFTSGNLPSQIVSRYYEITTVASSVNDDDLLVDANGVLTECRLQSGLIKIPQTVTDSLLGTITITSVGEYVFSNSENGQNSITGVIFSNSVETIGARAFYESGSVATSLQLVEANGVTEIGDEAFSDCDSLKTCNIDNVQYINYAAFYDCEGMFKLNLPDLVEVGDEAFYCSSINQLQNLTSLITVGEYSFYGCMYLRYLESPLLTTIGVRAFSGCDRMKKFMAPLLQNVGNYSLGICERLKEVYMDTVEYIGSETFFYCPGLKKLYCPNLKELPALSVYYCLSLKCLELPSVTSISSSFPQFLKTLIVSSSFQSSYVGSTAGLTVYGTAGSFAQTWAASQGSICTFIAAPVISKNLPEYVYASDTLTFNVIGFNKTYQWYYNTTNSTTGGTAIQGATLSTYTIPDENIKNYYYCVATSTDASVTTTLTSDVSTYVGVNMTVDENGNITGYQIGDGTKTMSETYGYTAGIEYPTSIIDANGNTVYYEYDETTGLPVEITAGGAEIDITYDASELVSGISQPVSGLSNGSTISNGYTYDTEGQATGISHNDFSYGFTYDEDGNNTAVSVGSQPLASYTYDTSGYLDGITYGNGEQFSYEYDSSGNVTGVYWYRLSNWVPMYECVYDSNGNLTTIYDNFGQVFRHYYDNGYDVVSYIGYEVLYSVEYDEDGNATAEILGESFDISKSSEAYSSATKCTTRASSMEYLNTILEREAVFDYFGRSLSSSAVSYDASDSEIITCSTDIEYNDTSTTAGTQVESYNSAVSNGATELNGLTFSYMYDSRGNITEIYDATDTLYAKYTYDEANQLTREDNAAQNKSVTYSYDKGGNIVSKSEYAYTTGTLGTATDTVGYTYDITWKDELTSYDGMSITYDGLGNPLTYGDYDIFYSWLGRELLYYSKSEYLAATFQYNSDGLRTRKSISCFNPSTLANYYYSWSADGTLLGYRVETYSPDSIADVWIIYGENGDAIGFTVTDYEGVEPTTYTYYYIKNAQGDVLRVVDETGATMADYTYDAWGNFTYTADPNAGANADIIERYNPVTYRGYYYDTDLEMYYLQSRYYNPQWGRFLNADICADTGESIVGTNMFAYCSNNPVMLIDPSGELAAFGFENNSDNWYGWFTTPWSTKKNAWQKKFGYCDLYDYTAPALKIYIDCLISEFEFGTLKWRVQLWKGKYGPSVGAEIGFYHQSKDRRFFRSFYICSDDIWFQMSFTLYWSDDNYDLHEIFSVEAGEQGHWWLTGFLANSVYSILPGTPQNLVMLAVIDFKNAEMANGFKDNLGKRVGTGYFDALVVGNQAIITWAPENHEYTIT